MTGLPIKEQHHDRTVLLSGGADSAAGIAVQFHRDLPGTAGHRQFHLHRASKRLNGSPFRNETSTRSRSLLFLVLAERVGSTLWIAENGFASLNPPLGPDRRGSLSTHTTHPRFLRELSALMQKFGRSWRLIENLFETLMKSEMFRRVAEALGIDAASTLPTSLPSSSGEAVVVRGDCFADVWRPSRFLVLVSSRSVLLCC